MKIANVYPGRFNPPSTSHKKIIDNMLNYDGDNYIFIIDGLKTSENKDKNPLSYNDRKSIFLDYYPTIKIDMANNIIMALDILDVMGYQSIRIFCGEDRYLSYKNISYYYNIDISIICQERNDNISATNIRNNIRNNNGQENLFPISNIKLKNNIIRKIYDSTSNTL